MKTPDNENLVVLCGCTLNQWALDFDGNFQRILQSIRIAKEHGARLRIGPDLEICGNSCEDHFFETDTYTHSWECMARLLAHPIAQDILCEIGAPVLHKGARYNCRIWFLNRRILLVRPKSALSETGASREYRYFTPWPHSITARNDSKEEIELPFCIRELIGQKVAPFGFGIIHCANATLSGEFNQELYSTSPPHQYLCLEGVDIITNGGGVYYQQGRFEHHYDTVIDTTRKYGGAYMYTNMAGYDGGTLVYDGGSLVSVNGEIVGISHRFPIGSDIQCNIATIDIQVIQSFRGNLEYFSAQKSSIHQYKSILSAYHHVDLTNYSLTPGAMPNRSNDILYSSQSNAFNLSLPILRSSLKDQLFFDCPHELARATCLWLWDYLRRTPKCGGFFLPLSGGADSACVAVLVAYMCSLLVKEVKEYSNDQVATDLAYILGVDAILPKLKVTCTSNDIHAHVLDSVHHYDQFQRLNDHYIPCGCIGKSTTTFSFRAESLIYGYMHVHPKAAQHVCNTAESIDAISDEDQSGYIYLTDARQLCHEILHTCFMSSSNSSSLTRDLSLRLSDQVGAYHTSGNIDLVTQAFITIVKGITGMVPRFLRFGGTLTEDLALQNIQARSRMVLAYFLAQILPTCRGKDVRATQVERQRLNYLNDLKMCHKPDLTLDVPINFKGWISPLDYNADKMRESFCFHSAKTLEMRMDRGAGTFLLLLGTGNLDEVLYGYYTKYDCSSADINPIGSLNKDHIRMILEWASTNLEYYVLQEIIRQPPSAELRPSDESDVNSRQTDEQEMGMTYSELGVFSRLRGVWKYGPVSIFKHLLGEWKDVHKPSVILSKVQAFLRHYCASRHKTCTLTPSVHLTAQNASDSRVDHRPILYPNLYLQFKYMQRIADASQV